MPTQSPLRRIFKLLADRKAEVAFSACLVVGATALDITVPFISQHLIDTLIRFFTSRGAAPVQTVIFAASGIFLATLGASAFNSTYGYRMFKLATSIQDKMKNRAFEKYLRLHALFHHGSSSGQMIGRIERGGDAIYTITYDLFGFNLIPPFLSFTGVTIALLLKNPLVALVIVLPLPIYLLAVRRLTSRVYEIEKLVNDQFETVGRESYDVASNVLTVKKFSQEDAETTNQARLFAVARDTQYRAERLWTLIESTQTLIATIGRITVIVVGGFFVLWGKSTVGEFVLFITLQNMAYSPLSRLAIIFPRLRRNMTRVERLFGILDEPVRVVDAPRALTLPPLAKEIRFDKASFRYAENRPWALKDLNLKIPAGTTVALVGRSGSGKTTFINLLLRSFDPNEGAITIDGHDLREVTQDSLRAQIAVVPQEVDLFSRTIRENIAYGQPQVTEGQVEEAARTALAHDFILKMDEGYDTVVGERGIKLSGGERQRVGIARAVLRDPRILIFDEATSHLDTESERLIQKATDALIKNRTSFIIAHRLSTVINAALILVFEGGKIEAMGNHAALLKKSPTYRRLHDLQFAE